MYRRNEIGNITENTAGRLCKYRRRRKAVQNLRENMTVESLWETLLLFQDYPFYTAKKLKFTYQIKGNEMFVDRKDKSITMSTVDLAFRRALELGEEATGPKKLGCFGASYLYPVFIRLGIIAPLQHCISPRVMLI